jgi:DNA-binding transcriptional MerR regulator
MRESFPGFESTRSTYSIGDAINLLRNEFPDLSVSKLRFLEGQGLIAPARSASGYRMFSDEDIRRIQYILREQRDHFLPLKVIKSKLTAWERGEEAPVRPDSGPPPESYFANSGISMTPEELARSSGLTLRQIEELVGQGVLEPLELDDKRRVYRDDDLTIARAAHRLLVQGLEVRHLRALRLAADRETDLLRQLVSPLFRHRNPDNRRRAAEILADTAQAGSLLQEGIVRSRLRRLLER